MITFLVITSFAFAVFLVLQHPAFGKMPSGERLERVQKSPHYKNGKFRNLSPTKLMNRNYFVSMWNYVVNKSKRTKPSKPLPHIKTDLHALNREDDIMVWFGHSSYFIQINGLRFLADPVFPQKGTLPYYINPPFKGTNVYFPQDIPQTDYVVISHDHWDHLDYHALKALKPKIKKIICPLGTGAYFEHWGFSKDSLIELDWYETQTLSDKAQVECLPARHFSGRMGLFGDKTLWASYMLNVNGFKIFIGGDSGYDSFFKQIGEKYGAADIAFLENGQYNEDWDKIHMMPSHSYRAAQDLKAKTLMPVHSSKFSISPHAWDDPLIKITNLAKDGKVRVITPKIGQIVYLKDTDQKFENWWEGAED